MASSLLTGMLVSVSLLAAACGGSGPKVESPPSIPSSTPMDVEPETEADTTATLDILSGEPTEILLDGKPIGTTPITGYKVAPGSHDVTFVDEARGNRTFGVNVGPGQAQTIKSDVPPTATDAPGAPKKK